MKNDKKMLFEAMHKVGGMPLNEDYQDNGVDNFQPLDIGHNIYKEVMGLINNQAGEEVWSGGAENALNFYLKVLEGIKDALYQDLGDSINPNAGAAPDEMSEVENEIGGGEKFRAEVTGKGENRWSGNAMEYDTEEEAKEWLDNLASRWFGFDMSRVVPVSMPTGQPLDMENDIIYQNLRG